MSQIFISYRREDSADVAGRLNDRLVGHFGQSVIFRYLDSIPIGADFRDHLADAVGRCSVLLVIIGKGWLEVRSQKGRRLDDPDDFVRFEIETALLRGIPVIPLLIQGATMPAAPQLPTVLHELAYRNALPIRADPDFHKDVDRLVRHLKNSSESQGAVSSAKSSGQRIPKSTGSTSAWSSLMRIQTWGWLVGVVGGLVLSIILFLYKPMGQPGNTLENPTANPSTGEGVQPFVEPKPEPDKTLVKSVSLMWDNQNDLDLYCLEPNREEISPYSIKSSSGGKMDMHSNSRLGTKFTNYPVENIFWSGPMPLGVYQVRVTHAKNQGGSDPTHFKVRVIVEGVTTVYEGSISEGQTKFIGEFKVTR